MGILWEHSFWAFFFITIVTAGIAAFATGRALAQNWRPFWQVVVYALLLGCADRFLHWGLFLDYPLDRFKGNLFSLHYYLVDSAILIAIASLAFQLARAKQMTTQYRWLYRRTGPLSWQPRRESDA